MRSIYPTINPACLVVLTAFGCCFAYGQIERPPGDGSALSGNRVRRGPAESETVTFTNQNGKRIESAKVVKVTPTSVFYTLPNGVCCGEVKLSDLTGGLQDHFGFSPQKATAYQAGLQDEYKRAGQAKQGIVFKCPPDDRDESDGVKTRTVSDIVSLYHQTHSYIGRETGAVADIFVCGDMAMDVWDMAQAKGVNAQIAIGNLTEDAQSFTNANHAWVVAETRPGKWLALETTGGRVVWGGDNLRYYSPCHCFQSPKEYKEYVDLAHQWDAAVAKAREAGLAYNAAVDEYNGALLPYRGDLSVKLGQKATVVEQRDSDLMELKGKIQALLGD